MQLPQRLIFHIRSAKKICLPERNKKTDIQGYISTSIVSICTFSSQTETNKIERHPLNISNALPLNQFHSWLFSREVSPSHAALNTRPRIYLKGILFTTSAFILVDFQNVTLLLTSFLFCSGVTAIRQLCSIIFCIKLSNCVTPTLTFPLDITSNVHRC